MKRIGILGGTFNPIHVSHIMIALAAKDALCLDKVLVMPSKRPPHKENSGIASDTDRAAMTELAIRGLEGFELSRLELDRDSEYTYTSDTLKELAGLYPDSRFYFIIGGDSLEQFHTWHEPGEILKNCVLVATGRGSVDAAKIKAVIQKLKIMYSECSGSSAEGLPESSGGFVPEICYIQPPQTDLSSNLIRKLLSYDMSVCGMLHPEVESYIAEHGLYRNDEYERIKERLKGLLKPRRFEHTISVAKTAAKLALLHGEDPDRAYLAGLLHDCAKYLDDEAMLSEGELKCPDLDDFDRGSIQLIHAKLGAVYAKEQYGINDEEILRAIKHHTTGCPNMSLLEEIVYIADYTEPGRGRATTVKQQELEYARCLSTCDIKATMRYILKCTYDYLMSPENKYPVSPMTKKTYEFYEAMGNR